LVAGLAFVVTAPGHPVPAAAASAGGQPMRPVDARAVFLRDCATCHGARGQGTPFGPAIDQAEPGLVHYELSTGRMPKAQADDPRRRRPPRYTSAEIGGLVRYVAGLAPGGDTEPPRVGLTGADVARGGELYRLNCAACHSWSGTGGALLRREAPSLLPSTPTQVVEAVRTGPGAMPSFGTASFTDQEVIDIAAYVREVQHPEDRGGQGLWHLGPLVEGAVGWIIGIGSLLLFIVWVGAREPRGGRHEA
jgi:ubiquinol-cytochrome c reductase cytochrome c subunit